MEVFEGWSILVSFGLLFIIQNIALLAWGADERGYSFLAFPINLLGARFPANRLVALLLAVVIGLSFFLFLVRTRLGKAIRAAAQEEAGAQLVGSKHSLDAWFMFWFWSFVSWFSRCPYQHDVHSFTIYGSPLYHHCHHRRGPWWIGQYHGKFSWRLDTRSHRQHCAAY